MLAWPAGLLAALALSGCASLMPGAGHATVGSATAKGPAPLPAPAAPAAPVVAPTGASAPEAEASGVTPPPVLTTQAIDDTRRTVRSTAEWLARGVDGWFGDKPFEDGGSVRDGVLRLSVLKRQTEKVDVDLRFKARFRLPNVEQKTYLFLGRDDRENNIRDRPGALSEAERTGARPDESPSFFAGLGREFGEMFDLRLGFRGVKPYAQARLQKDWQLGPQSYIDVRETLFWTPSDRFGSTTAISWDWSQSPALVVRWVAAATITQDVPDFNWSTVLGGYRNFGERRLLALEALASGLQNSRRGPTDYGGQVRWIQPIYRHWLLGEILLGRFWLRNDPAIPRRPVWALGTTLTMEF